MTNADRMIIGRFMKMTISLLFTCTMYLAQRRDMFEAWEKRKESFTEAVDKWRES
jgi:hypothetical protein